MLWPVAAGPIQYHQGKETPMNIKKPITRRSFMRGAAYGTAGALCAPYIIRGASAQEFPSRTMQVLIPISEGGGVDRSARAFNAAWGPVLGQDFEYSYFPGASGQVGYETYMGRREPDCYNLLFGAIAPEMIMYATQNPSYTYPDDYLYFAGVNNDDSVIWVADDSPFQTLEDLIEEGQSRTVTFSGSRLPHPSSIAVFLLGEHTGASFNVIPYGGGSAARSAALTGEVDACCTFMGSSLSLADQIRFLTVFQDRNRLPGQTNDAQPVNELLGTDFPALDGRRAFAIHRAAVEEYPERFELLKQTAQEAFESPAYEQAVIDGGMDPAFMDFADEETCARAADSILELARRFEHLFEE
jgi:tripartite-type tricarboxylate transporter receptor subunit TctC